jgi:hypothetical protein
MTRIASALDNGPVDREAPRATGRHRIRAIAYENGFLATDGGPRPDTDEFIRVDRVVHVEYGPDDRVLDIRVNGECLFNRDRSLADHRRRISAYGLADRLEGADG